MATDKEGLRLHDPSYRPDCPACQRDRRHTAAETAEFHPLAGHGYAEGQGWSLPSLEGGRDAK